MAESLEADSQDFHHGEMPVAAQRATFHSVMGLVKWGSLALACLLILLVMVFCTGAGLFPSLVCAAILAVAGGVFLGRKGGGH